MWVKVDEQFPEHGKVSVAGARLGAYGTGRVLAVWLAMSCYANERKTGGFLPLDIVRHCRHDKRPLDVARAMSTPIIETEAAAYQLTPGGPLLWIQVDGGYRIHDYEKYQPTPEEFVERRSQRKEAGRKGGLASAAARRLKKSEATDEAHEANREATTEANAQARTEANAQAKTNPDPDPGNTPPTPPGDLRTAYGLITEQHLADRAGAFFERWRQLHERKRFGAAYPTMGPNRRNLPSLCASPADFRHCVTLCDRYPDDVWLDLIAEVFLSAVEGDLSRKPKTLGWLVYFAHQIDGTLRENGRRPAMEQAAS